MANTEWTKLTVHGRHDDLETICAVMSMVENGLMIEDYSDFSLNGMYGELVDDSILRADRDAVAVSVFLPIDRSPAETRGYLTERFAALSVPVTIECEGVREEDWAEAWKQYYEPIPLGRVTVVPAWQEYTAREDEIVVRMDPGMAFGTGTHETTRLVIRLLTDIIRGGETVLDVGTGSGILAVCASKLGAASVTACDIDPVAVRVACDNVRENGCENITCMVSDLLASVPADGRYKVCTANIVADIILRLLPDLGARLTQDGCAIFSGIIESRADEVRDALRAYGYTIVKEEKENDWVAVLAAREA